MIKLIVNGVTLPVPEGLNFTRSFDTTIFTRGKEVSDFTYPVDFPLTDEVIAGLGFINSLATPTIVRSFPADFYLHGSYIDKVTLNILNISLSKKVMTANISGLYGTFAKLLGDIYVNQLELDGIKTVGTVNVADEGYSIGLNNGHVANVAYNRCTTGTHMANVTNGIVQADYAFPVAKDTGNNLPNTHDGSNINVLNAWDYNNNQYLDPVWAYIMDRWHNTDLTTGYRFFWVPMFYCHYVLRKCFEEAGFSVSGNFFTDARFTKILLYNTYAINRCTTSYSVSGNTRSYHISHNATTIDPKNHVPKMKVIDFVTELAKYLNLKLDIDLTNRIVAVNVFSNGVSDFTFVDLSDKVIADPEIVFEEQDFQQGFDFSFSFDPKDAESGASVQTDIYDLNYAGTISQNAYYLFPSAPSGSIVYVRSWDKWFKYDGSGWMPYGGNQQGYATGTGDNLVKITTLFVPVQSVYRTPILYMQSQTSAGYYNLSTSCVQSGIGILGADLLYINNLKDQDDMGMPDSAVGVGTAAEIITQPHVVNYFGMQQMNSGATFPYCSGGCYSPLGLSIYTNSLCLDWYTPEGYGVAQTLWKPFTDLVKNGIAVKWTVEMDIVKFLNIDFNKNGIRIQGQNYLCKKADIVYPFPNLSTLTLVRI